MWRTKLSQSTRTQQCAYLLHALLFLALLQAPWPLSRVLIGPILFLVVLLDARRIQRRIAAVQGEIVLFNDATLGWHLHWQGKIWYGVARPMITPWGVWLQIRCAEQWQRLWLAFDSMPPTAWRNLCRILKHHAVSATRPLTSSPPYKDDDSY